MHTSEKRNNQKNVNTKPNNNNNHPHPPPKPKTEKTTTPKKQSEENQTPENSQEILRGTVAISVSLVLFREFIKANHEEF